jgi:hypothetical protein
MLQHLRVLSLLIADFPAGDLPSLYADAYNNLTHQISDLTGVVAERKIGKAAGWCRSLLECDLDAVPW